MPKDILPQHVNPIRFAENAVRLEGILPIKSMERLKSSLVNDEGEVEANLEFGMDKQGIKYMKGHLTARVTLQCQRCLNPFVYEIMDDFLSGFVNADEQTKELPERFDPLLINAEELMLQDVIEDELIVSLPIVPLHNEKDCEVHLPYAVGEIGMVDNVSPFKVIESLKQGHNNLK